MRRLLGLVQPLAVAVEPAIRRRPCHASNASRAWDSSNGKALNVIVTIQANPAEDSSPV